VQNGRTVREHAAGTTEREEGEERERDTRRASEAERQQASEAARARTVPVVGRRVINSPYILKPAKIRDLKKCADRLQLGGYAKVGKPGIVVIEGPEAGCKQYCPMLQDLGWKYQKVQGEQQQWGVAGESVDQLRLLPTEFRVLGEDSMSELSRICREAGLADFFFTSLKMHNSASGIGVDATKEIGRKKGGKK